MKRRSPAEQPFRLNGADFRIHLQTGIPGFSGDAFLFPQTCRCRAGISGDSPDRGCPASPGEEEKAGADHADGTALYAGKMLSFCTARCFIQALLIPLN